jgi:hypothetical protein
MDTSDKISNLELKLGTQITKHKTTSNKYEPKVALEDKVYFETYYIQLRNVTVDETPTKVKHRNCKYLDGC